MKIPLKHYFSNSNRDFDVELSVDDSYDYSYDPGKCLGFYAELSGKPVGLFAINDRLFVLLEGKTVEVSDSFSVCHEARDDSSNLAFEIGTNRHSIAYENENTPVSTQFYSEDVEDADFGLWLSNVLNSRERTTAILETWSGGM